MKKIVVILFVSSCYLFPKFVSAKPDSVVVELKGVYYEGGKKRSMGLVNMEIELGKEALLSLTFGTAEKNITDYRYGSCFSSHFRTYFDLKRRVKPSPLESNINSIPKATPLLIYNFYIVPERIQGNKVKVKLAYEKNDFIQFSGRHKPIYERSISKMEFEVTFGKPKEIIVVSESPIKVAAELTVKKVAPVPLEEKISSYIREELENLKPIDLPVTFYIEYVRKDNRTGKVLFRKRSIQRGFNRRNPFNLDFLVETPMIFRQNDRVVNYSIRGYLVPVEKRKEGLKVILLAEQWFGQLKRGGAGQSFKKDLLIKKGETLEIELMPHRETITFMSKKGRPIRFDVQKELFKGNTESLFLKAKF